MTFDGVTAADASAVGLPSAPRDGYTTDTTGGRVVRLATTGRRMFSSISLGIVSPMANEEDTAVPFVEAVLAQCEPFGLRAVRFFAVLDRVSRDRTRERLEALAATEPRLTVVWAPENRSVVDAYMRGYREAMKQSDWILEIDAGFSHQPSEIPRFLERMVDGYDCVFGSRFMAGGSIAGTPLKRRAVSRGGTILANLVLGTRLSDMTSGFQLFTKAALAEILERGIRSRGPFFQTEMKAFARRLRTAEVPITYRNASHSVGSAALADSFARLWRLYRLRLQDRL